NTATLAAELNRLQTDLIGDGWQIIRHDVSSSDTPASVRALIINDYNADPANLQTVFLFGHVPVFRSGLLNYDTHGARPMPADSYYGDVDGDWSNNPSYLPSDVELMVGRVDFSNMPGNGAPIPWPCDVASSSQIGTHGLYNDVWSTDLVGQDGSAVFNLLYGSHLGEWDQTDDILRAALATPSLGLTSCLGGRPHWFLHHMGLGEPIG